MKEIDNINFLKEKSVFLRKQICYLANQEQIDHVHLGGLLSVVDVLCALYYKYMRFDPQNVDDSYRDKFVAGKAHCAVLLYIIFADMGVYSFDYIFKNFKKFGHPFYQVPIQKVKGIEVSTGSLGLGLSVAVGMAIANRSEGINSRIYCLTGDGEMQEGSNWEAIMYAGSHKLSNLVCILDNNQCTAAFRYGDNIIVDWEKAFNAFNWDTIVIDGSNMEDIVKTFESMPEVDFLKENKPLAIISYTRKGQNVDFIQGPAWHYGSLNDKSLQKALECIENNKR